MSSNYIPFYTGIWSDKKIKQLIKLEDEALRMRCLLIFIYIFTNPNINLSGIYQFEKEQCMFRFNMSQEKFNEAFNLLVQGEFNLKWDEETEKIWVVNRFKLIPNNMSPKVIGGVINELNLINHPFKNEWFKKYHLEIKDYRWKVKGYHLTLEEASDEEFIKHASSLYPSKKLLKEFICNKGVSEERLDSILNRILPNFK